MSNREIMFPVLGLDGSDMNRDMQTPAQIIDGREHLLVRRNFIVDGLEDSLMRGSESFFFSPEFAGELGLNGRPLAYSQFSLREDWAEGRQNSAQGVFFGELTLELGEKSTGIEAKTVPVACKPYPVLQRFRAVHEYAAMRRFAARAVPQSYDPLGFWVTEGGNQVLLSRFEEQVVSFDNVRWNEPKQMSLFDETDAVRALKKSARILALLHTQGFVHQDAQVKNMAMDVKSGDVRLIDLTTLYRVHSPEKPDPVGWSNGVRLDLLQLISTVQELMPKRVPKEEQREVMELGFLALHSAVLSHPSSRGHLPDGNTNWLKQAYEGVADYFEAKPDHRKPKGIDLLLSATLS